MAEFPNQIFAPVPINYIDRDLLGRLAKELQEERDKNFSLARDLAVEKYKMQQLECYLLSLASPIERGKNDTEPLANENKKFPKNESIETLASNSDLKEIKPKIGEYSYEARHLKILKYKEKVKKYRQKVHVSRNFSGRSTIAKIKPRVNGKFVKRIGSDMWKFLELGNILLFE